MTLAGVLIYINWQVYILAVVTGHVVEGALGYFINPIVTVLLGVFFLRERLRPAQWVSLGISFAAILVIAIGYGSFPWIALALAFSFGLYGYVKKRVGDQVDPVSGLTLETAVLTPVAVVILAVLAATSGIVTGNVKEYGIKAIERHGPYELAGDPAIMRLLDELLAAFVAQRRMKLPGTEYRPVYRLVA